MRRDGTVGDEDFWLVSLVGAPHPTGKHWSSKDDWSPKDVALMVMQSLRTHVKYEAKRGRFLAG